jgi:amino acid permease
MPSDIDNAPLSAPSRSLSVEDAKKEKDDSALVPQLLTIDDPAVAASDDGRKKPVMELRRDLTSRQISMISIVCSFRWLCLRLRS